MNQKDHFAHKADNYETESRRVNNVANIANGILDRVEYSKSMHIIDLGSGTGLLTSKIAPFVAKVTAIDKSESMSRVLRAKAPSYPCELEVLDIDIADIDVDTKYDGIISSMTLHHIADIKKLFTQFYSLLRDGGSIALADLDIEDGSFHTEDTGVHHFGFDREWLVDIAKRAGFVDIICTDVSVATKPHGDYPIFLLTAKK